VGVVVPAAGVVVSDAGGMGDGFSGGVPETRGARIAQIGWQDTKLKR
jgi:hypothetical protein